MNKTLRRREMIKISSEKSRQTTQKWTRKRNEKSAWSQITKSLVILIVVQRLKVRKRKVVKKAPKKKKKKDMLLCKKLKKK